MEQFYLYVAVPASIILVIQTIMTFLGASGEIDVDYDGDGDVEMEGGSHFTIFSVRNLVAFFTFFGWSGLWMNASGFGIILTVIVSVAVGILFVMISMGMFFLIAKMQRSGNMDLKLAIGLVGEVYIPIAGERKRSGKVLLNLQGGLRELEAVTDEVSVLSTGTEVEVVGVLPPSKLIVAKTNHKGENNGR